MSDSECKHQEMNQSSECSAIIGPRLCMCNTMQFQKYVYYLELVEWISSCIEEAHDLSRTGLDRVDKDGAAKAVRKCEQVIPCRDSITKSVVEEVLVRHEVDYPTFQNMLKRQKIAADE